MFIEDWRTPSSCATPISACSGKAPRASTRSISFAARSAARARTRRSPIRCTGASIKRRSPVTSAAASRRYRSRRQLRRERAQRPDAEASCRRAASALYHAASAALLAAEGAELGQRGGDARRLLLARLVLDHRLGNADPFALPDDHWEDAVTAKLLDDHRSRCPRPRPYWRLISSEDRER